MPTQVHTGDKAVQVAKYFIQKSYQEPNKGLDAKKLQKLLYYSQAWSLVVRNKEIFHDHIEAWIHGPAIYKVWNTFKTHDFTSVHPQITGATLTALDDSEKKFLDSIWALYGKFDGEYLEALTHSESPWQEARKDLDGHERSNTIIPTESMKAFYGKRLAEAEQRS